MIKRIKYSIHNSYISWNMKDFFIFENLKCYKIQNERK